MTPIQQVNGVTDKTGELITRAEKVTAELGDLYKERRALALAAAEGDTKSMHRIKQIDLKALELLPRRDAEILMLKYTENWSYRELAENLGISQTAVQARLHRARQKLREELAALDVVGGQL